MNNSIQTAARSASDVIFDIGEVWMKKMSKNIGYTVCSFSGSVTNQIESAEIMRIPDDYYRNNF